MRSLRELYVLSSVSMTAATGGAALASQSKSHRDTQRKALAAAAGTNMTHNRILHVIIFFVGKLLSEDDLTGNQSNTS
jgi:hypothetical protein